MEVDKFFSLIDTIRYDTDLDEQYPELRSMAQRCYPLLRKFYNKLLETGMLTESHGAKKHNGPKSTLAAVRKGSRDADMELNGPGFKSNTKTHKTSKADRKPMKINKDNYEKFVGECVSKVLREFVDNVDYSEKEDYGDYYPGIEVNWGEKVESLIKQLSNIFAEYNAPEEDEFGFKQTAFDDMIAHLKYYYDVKQFNAKVFNKIQAMMENYDLVQDEKVHKILDELKMYC